VQLYHKFPVTLNMCRINFRLWSATVQARTFGIIALSL